MAVGYMPGGRHAIDTIDMWTETDAGETDVADAGHDVDTEPLVWQGRAIAQRMQGEYDDGLQSAGTRVDDRSAARVRVAMECRALSEGDPDAALVALVGARDESAVRQLVSRKLPRLLALAAHMLGDRAEAEDVAQETFLRVWKQAPSWREGEARFDTWLHRVVLNLCYDRMRGRRETLADTLPEVCDPKPEPAVQAEYRSRDARVRQALAALPARQREALVLQYYQEMSNLEAANLMGITVDALESLLVRARRNLRAQLAGDSPSEDIR